MVVSLDFDGTLVWTYSYPLFDPSPLPGLHEALDWMRKNLGCRFILLTQRDSDHVYNPVLGKAVYRHRVNDSRNSVLQDALDWCNSQGIELYGINENPDQSRNNWSTSRKVYSDLIIDDRSLLPLDSRGCVDWYKTLDLIKERYGKL